MSNIRRTSATALSLTAPPAPSRPEAGGSCRRSLAPRPAARAALGLAATAALAFTSASADAAPRVKFHYPPPEQGGNTAIVASHPSGTMLATAAMSSQPGGPLARTLCVYVGAIDAAVVRVYTNRATSVDYPFSSSRCMTNHFGSPGWSHYRLWIKGATGLRNELSLPRALPPRR